VGRSFVAGAQLAPLNPALGEYFRVEEGVLVMEVVEGTPAQEAGLVAGDVIVRVGSQDVSSLEDLRFGLGYVQGPLTVRVIRKGEALELRFFEKKEPRWREPREE
jgi:S1-C subfamily serine protease